MTFNELQLPEALIAALAKEHIAEPTPIQIAAVPVLLAGKDAYLHAETGTGKTLAYLLPIFCKLDVQQAATQTIVVAPTHELAIQIQRQATLLAQNTGWPVKTVLLIGGTSIDRQLDKLKTKPHIVVGSPGRIAELIDKGKLKTQHLRHIVVDEADRMLHPESLPAVRAIIAATKVKPQLLFASATLESQTVQTIALLTASVEMIRAGSAPVNENIEHLYLVCEQRDKPDELRKLLHALEPERAIVFFHRTDMSGVVASKLEHHHIAVADLSASLNKVDRKQAMDGFRSGKVQVLIASDVAARGLDIKGVTHVFNFDAPTLSKDYLHRAGRTGRAGAKGLSISLTTDVEARVIPRYQQELGITVQRVRLREGRVILA